jgi:hypothetical protein
MKLSARLKNMNQPAPIWFRKTKKIISLLSDAAIVVLLSFGYSENSLIMLVLRVGLSAVMNSLEVILASGEESVKVEE